MSDFELVRESIDHAPSFKVLITNYANQAEQRRLVSVDMNGDFSIKTPPMLYTKLQTYFDQFKAKYGALTSFTFTSPFDSVEYNVRYVPGTYKLSYKNALFQGKFKLKIVSG